MRGRRRERCENESKIEGESKVRLLDGEEGTEAPIRCVYSNAHVSLCDTCLCLCGRACAYVLDRKG